MPERMFEYKRAAIEDMEELVRTRIMVLRAANKLSDDADMSAVEHLHFLWCEHFPAHNTHPPALRDSTILKQLCVHYPGQKI